MLSQQFYKEVDVKRTFRRGRMTLAEQRDRIIRFNAREQFDAAAVGKTPRFQIPVPELPPKRNRVMRTGDNKPALPLEREVLAAALEALRYDPRVAFVDRRQSGVFQDGERYIRVGSPGVLDVSGMLKGGRYFELEAKRPGEKPDERQCRRIDLVRAAGGVSGYFTSADEALGLLP